MAEAAAAPTQSRERPSAPRIRFGGRSYLAGDVFLGDGSVPTQLGNGIVVVLGRQYVIIAAYADAAHDEQPPAYDDSMGAKGLRRCYRAVLATSEYLRGYGY